MANVEDLQTALIEQTRDGTVKWEPSKFRCGHPEVWRTTNLEGCRLELHVANGGLLLALFGDSWGIVGRYPETDELSGILHEYGNRKGGISNPSIEHALRCLVPKRALSVPSSIAA